MRERVKALKTGIGRTESKDADQHFTQLWVFFSGPIENFENVARKGGNADNQDFSLSHSVRIRT